ncbi:hypothetical protein HK097_006004 [Rhizophlyctis rosea]|uniref:non-specific serine/threonine protein kinase n=1 Tax=Rhizophlyctis rosea TaxID=64517 RepID=A0AAD5X2Z9_9FUNG|nr:hypothetical protein HK097_006004 [Rhizophlyctis rosea]
MSATTSPDIDIDMRASHASPPAGPPEAPLPPSEPWPEVLQTLNGSWTKVKKLGAGTFGTVLDFRNAGGEHVAVKMSNKAFPHHGDILLHEVGILQHLAGSKYAPAYKEHGMTDTVWWVMMEFVDGRTVQDWMKSGPWTEPKIVQNFLRLLLEAVQDFKKEGICHRDLKGDNILLGTTGDLKVVDFGVAGRPLVPEMGGALPYRPPEALLHFPEGHSYDIWSIGRIALEVATGQTFPNFGDERTVDRTVLFWTLQAADLGLDRIKDQNLRHLAQQMLNRLPTQRSSVEAALAHPYFHLPLSSPLHHTLSPPPEEEVLSLTRERDQLKREKAAVEEELAETKRGKEKAEKLARSRGREVVRVACELFSSKQRRAQAQATAEDGAEGGKKGGKFLKGFKSFGRKMKRWSRNQQHYFSQVPSPPASPRLAPKTMHLAQVPLMKLDDVLEWTEEQLDHREKLFREEGRDFGPLEIPGTFDKEFFLSIADSPKWKHLRTEFDNGKVRVKERPSGPHEAGHKAIFTRMTVRLAQVGGDYSFYWIGSKRTWWSPNRSKEADESFVPEQRLKNGLPHPIPTLVVEVGMSGGCEPYERSELKCEAETNDFAVSLPQKRLRHYRCPYGISLS